MKKEYYQPGLGINPEDSAPHPSPQKEDSTKKRKKPKKHGLTPYEEAMRFRNERDYGQGSVVEETLDGGVRVRKISPTGEEISEVGEADNDGRPVKVESPSIKFSDLSPKAQKVYWALQNKRK